jgi:mono/diheme cytochrome c family protein
LIRALMFFMPVVMWAQGGADILTRGADIFARSCATGYCHGVKGTAGGAPRLAARGLDEAFILNVTRSGVPGTAMQAYGTLMPRADLAAVVAYVASLNGITPSRTAAAPTGPEPRSLSPDASRGRAMFFDSVRGFARCGTCHQVDGFGIPVAAPMAKVPADARALRDLETPEMKTATVEGDTFPALIVSKGARRTSLYDLTSPPPVLRSVDSSAIKIADASSWKHSSVLGAYRDQDLDAILIFLKAVVHP